MKLDNPGKADVVLDPDLGYIYVPLADFRILNEKLTKIMTTDSQGHDVAPYLYPCQTQLGACVFNISCQEASTYMSDTGKSLQVSFLLDDKHGGTYLLEKFSSYLDYFMTGTAFGFT